MENVLLVRGVGSITSRFLVWLLLIVGVLFQGFPHAALAFPEMVRHGYINCTSCHVSPSGGGVLTEYGRELSREVLSTWGRSNLDESAFAYKTIKPPKELDLMGFYRSVYAYQKTPFIEQGLYIFMQNDLEAALSIGQWKAVATLGYQNQASNVTVLDHLISRRHYLNYRPNEVLSFRVGRFFPAFGINTADHVIPTKRSLGWNEGQESYNFEAAWIGDPWNLFLTGNFGSPDQPSLNREMGALITPSLSLGDTYKIGVSYYYGANRDFSRHLGGIWGILGFTPHLFLLTEWDAQIQQSKTSDTSQSGIVNYQRFDYEVTQGVHIYLTQDLSQLDLTSSRTLSHSFGVGMQFFPRPHFEFNLSWQKLRALSVTDSYTDYAWILFHYYL